MDALEHFETSDHSETSEPEQVANSYLIRVYSPFLLEEDTEGPPLYSKYAPPQDFLHLPSWPSSHSKCQDMT